MLSVCSTITESCSSTAGSFIVGWDFFVCKQSISFVNFCVLEIVGKITDIAIVSSNVIQNDISDKIKYLLIKNRAPGKTFESLGTYEDYKTNIIKLLVQEVLPDMLL